MNSLLNTITLFNYMLACFTSETSELGDVPDEVISELYSQYKEVVANDNNTLLRRFFKRKNLHDIHVEKLKEVSGLKMHNLNIKEIGRSNGNPIEYIYINNPVESNIPKTFLTLKEFKENLYNRVKKQVIVTTMNANVIKSQLYKTKINKKGHKVNGTRGKKKLNTKIIVNKKTNTDLKKNTVNASRNVKTLKLNKEYNTKFMKTIKKLPSTVTITKIFSSVGHSSDNRISRVFQNVNSNFFLNTQKATTLKVIPKPTSTSKDGMISEKTYSKNTQIKTSFKDTTIQKETLISATPGTKSTQKHTIKLEVTNDKATSRKVTLKYTATEEATTNQFTTTTTVVTPATKSTFNDTMILEETYFEITPSKTNIKDTPTEKETALNVSTIIKSTLKDTITLEAITKKESPTKTMVTPKLKLTSKDTTLLETGIIKFSPREVTFEDIATEKATITNNTQSSKLISEDITTLDLNTVTETSREIKVSTIKVTPKRKPNFHDTLTEESRTAEVTPRRRPILEDTITEPTTSNKETPRRNPVIRFTLKPKTTRTVIRSRRSTLGRPLVFMAS